MTETVRIKARVSNRYLEIDSEMPSVADAELPIPPAPLALDPDLNYRWPVEVVKWIDEYLFTLTGVGRTRGSVVYVLEVIESSRPDLVPVGLTWEWEC